MRKGIFIKKGLAVILASFLCLGSVQASVNADDMDDIETVEETSGESIDDLIEDNEDEITNDEQDIIDTYAEEEPLIEEEIIYEEEDSPIEEVDLANDAYEYKLDKDDNATITKYLGSDSQLVIPDTLDGYKVIGIDPNVFKENNTLVSVSIPDSVLTIGEGAFLGCENLSSVKLSKSVNKIGGFAFGYCPSLTSIEIPKSLESTTDAYYYTYLYGYYPGVFIHSDNLKNVTFEKGSSRIANGLFAYNDGLESIVIPDTVTEIGTNAFRGCKNLKDITYSSSLTKISNNAFYGCKSIEEAIIPDTVTEILAGAYCACESLSNVHLSRKLVKLGGYAFGDCDSLVSIEIPKSLQETTSEYYNEYLYDYHYGVFIASDNLKNITFEEGTTLIPRGLFANNASIEHIEMPDTVVTIDNSAFEYCEGLKSIKLSNSITKIGNNTFSGCKSLESIDIPNSVTEIAAGAFLKCKNLSSVTLSKKLKTMGAYAFGDCDSLVSIEIPKSLESTTDAYYYEYKYGYFHGVFIASDNLKNVTFEKGATVVPNGLFAYNEGIESITLPNTIEKIGDAAFMGCKNLSQIKISSGIKTIENSAFRQTAIEEIVLPDTVTSVGTWMFEGCNNLSSVKLPNKTSEITEHMFENCGELKTVTIPDTVTAIRESAFENSGLEEITLSKNVNQIDNYAFYNNVKLKKIEFGGNETSIGRGVFKKCAALDNVIIPDTVTNIGIDLFYGCESLKNIEIGMGIIRITENMFYGDSSLEKINIPYQVKQIDKNAFLNCVNLTDININRLVTQIASEVFSYPDRMTIYGVQGSYAETYAEEKDIKFVAFDNPTTDIELSVDSIEIAKGDYGVIKSKLIPVDSQDEITFTSTDSDIVTVDEYGKINGVGIGKAQIFVMSGNVLKTVEVEVYKNVSSVYIEKSNYNGARGTKIKIEIEVYPEDAKYKEFEWYSNDESVVTVDNEGNATLVSDGEARVSVRLKNGREMDYCWITVADIAVSGIKLDKKTVELGINDSIILSPTIEPEDATDKSITWTSSKPGVAKVVNGKITGISEGTAVIIAKTNSGAKTASCTVTVVKKTENKDKFTDVRDAKKYYYEPVYWAFNNGVTTGTSENTFSPDDSCTRGQFVTFLWRYCGCPEPTTTKNFSDVKNGKYYYKAVMWAAEVGITTGYGGTDLFGVDDKCTREQCVTFIYRAAGKPEVTDGDKDTYGFRDAKNGYYADAVTWASKNGITTGVSKTAFGVGGFCTRGQLVTFLYRYADIEN